MSADLAVIDNPPLIEMRGTPTGLRVADFNGDTKLDFATLKPDVGGGALLVVYRGKGDGTFAAPVQTVLSGFPELFEVAPLDNDAVPDVVAAYYSSFSMTLTLRVFRGNGDGTFGTLLATFTESSCDRPVAFADMTGDGRTDVVACGQAVYPNLGGGSFGPAIRSGSFNSSGGYVVDANGDGKHDVVIPGDPATSLRLGNGDGTLQPAVTLDDGGRALSVMADFDGSGRADLAFIRDGLFLRLASPTGQYTVRTPAGFAPARSLTTADLNADGRPDLVASGEHAVWTWIMDASGTPSVRRLYRTASSANWVATGDFNGDGAVDVLMQGLGDAYRIQNNVVSLILGSADGTLAATRTYAVSGMLDDGRHFAGVPTGTAVSDVTGDGTPDLVAVASQVPAIAVFAGAGDGTFADAPQLTPVPTIASDATQPAPLFADVNGDGKIDVIVKSPAGAFYCFVANSDGTYGQTSEIAGPAYSGMAPTYAAGDFNGDGDVDLASLSGGTLQVAAGLGDGTFDAPVSGAYSVPAEGFRVGDVNNDGRDDLVFGSDVLLAGASGTFTKTTYAPGRTIPPAAVVDLDGDGNLDVVEDDPSSVSMTAVTSVLRGNGDGTFGARRSLPRLHYDHGTATTSCAGDFNGDGNTDLSFGPSIVLGDGEGWFNGYARVRDTGQFRRCSVGDVDGNGTADLVFAHYVGYGVSVATTHETESLALPLTLTTDSDRPAVAVGSPFTVTVRSSGQTQFAPTGGLVLSLSGAVLAIGELNGEETRVELVATTVGSQTLTAQFTGDDLYAATAAASRVVEITRAATEIGVTPWLPTWAYTTDVITATGTVSSSFPGVTGTVTLFVDGVERATTAALQFTLVAGELPAGVRTLRIDYSGDATHLPRSRTFQVDVQKAPVTMNITVDPPGPVVVGTPITVTVTFPDQPALTGTVLISDGAMVALGTPYNGPVFFGADVPVSNGVATWSTAAMPPDTRLGVYFYGTEKYAAQRTYVQYTINDTPAVPGPSSFYLITPCRLTDTREYRPIESGALLDVFAVHRCGIAFGAKAVAMNVTVVNPSSSGYLTVFPAVSPMPGTSTISYRYGKTRANNTILPLSAGGWMKVYNSGPHPAHVVIDVTGYFQ
ncbi:MAG TPA: FG-GAP-like repeat-containing protein [Thermoanaerobaculia bacterium]|nr:FG-GAP-like repeat-containing protein [Thermoanaerobaculia bacterium]